MRTSSTLSLSGRSSSHRHLRALRRRNNGLRHQGLPMKASISETFRPRESEVVRRCQHWKQLSWIIRRVAGNQVVRPAPQSRGKLNVVFKINVRDIRRFPEDVQVEKYDLSSLRHVSIAGEALNPEVFYKFREYTGLSLMEGFGQTETTLVIGNFVGDTPKPGSMGRPSPLFKVDIQTPEGKSCDVGETGEIVIDTRDGVPCGLFKGYYRNEEATKEAWHSGFYHTGDTAWRDEDGYFWYVGRIDDVIKSSGYRIGPFEIESVIMELPYVVECAITAVPDPIRGQIVKASVVLVKDKVGDEALVKEIQTYVKTHTAPYKYPRIVEFLPELPKTISGKIRRVELRGKK